MTPIEFPPIERLQSIVTPNNLGRAIPKELLLMRSYQIRALHPFERIALLSSPPSKLVDAQVRKKIGVLPETI